jgi:hypothetical protein
MIMKKQSKDKRTPREVKDDNERLTYPPYEDIYNQAEEMHEVDPDDISKLKAPNQKPGTKNEKDFEEAKSGSDLDIPGTEKGEKDLPNVEDEENDFYSLGADKDD